MDNLVKMKSSICRILLLAFFLASFGAVEAKNHDFKVDGLYYKIIADGKVEVTYEKKDSEKNYKNFSAVTVPGQVAYKGLEYTVVKIGDGAFHKSQISSVTFPKEVKEIGRDAFCRCTKLTSVSLPPDLETIDAGAFSVCSSLQSISLPESITSIGNHVFSSCYKLHEVILPSKLTVINYGLFSSSGIKKLELPKNIEKIVGWAFSSSDLEEIFLPDGLKQIDGYAFSFCKNLKEIYLPDGVESVGKDAFYYSPTKISYYYKTKFENLPDNSIARRQSVAEIAEQQRKEEARKLEERLKQEEREAAARKKKQAEEAFRKPIKWAPNVSDAKKAVIQAAYDDMVFIDDGTFQMGAKKAYKVDEPGHTVSLSPYLIGKYGVDQTLWSAVMGYNPSNNPSDDGPVDNVSWNDCMEFIKKLRQMTGIEFRLPTEAQWEYAAKGGSASKGYLYAGTNRSDNLYRKNRDGSIRILPNELGLYGMSGGVYEWCADWFGPYSDIEVKNPVGPAGGNGRVLRSGGGTTNYGGNINQVTERTWGGQAYKSENTGLRLVVCPKYKQEKILTPEQQARLNHPLLKKVVWAKGISDDRKEIIADAIADMVKVEGGTYTFRGEITKYTASNIPYGTELKMRAFYINKFEVSNKLWDAVLPGFDSFYRPKTGSARKPEDQVYSIDPDEINDFIKELNRLTGLTFSLPSEAQWEYAARGGNQSMGYAYAGTNDKSKLSNSAKQKFPNELGLYDMTGGVWELVSDEPYSEGFHMKIRVWRGGPETIFTRENTTFTHRNGGFRLVLNIK